MLSYCCAAFFLCCPIVISTLFLCCPTDLLSCVLCIPIAISTLFLCYTDLLVRPCLALIICHNAVITVLPFCYAAMFLCCPIAISTLVLCCPTDLLSCFLYIPIVISTLFLDCPTALRSVVGGCRKAAVTPCHAAPGAGPILGGAVIECDSAWLKYGEKFAISCYPG